jgi:PBP1b-binding outer membrane lipoprotein LpoB
MKAKAMLITLAVVTTLSVGCAQQPAPSTEPVPTPAPIVTPVPAPDVVTTASIVDNSAAFEKAISKEGTWIIAIVKDLAVDKDIVLDGDFLNGKKDDKGIDITQRKVALYSQDADRNITARYTLTAPKLTVNSLNASIQHGTFKGDVYVVGKNFQLIDTTVEGNIYFMNEEAKSTFTADDKSSITGVQELKK